MGILEENDIRDSTRLKGNTRSMSRTVKWGMTDPHSSDAIEVHKGHFYSSRKGKLVVATTGGLTILAHRYS